MRLVLAETDDLAARVRAAGDESIVLVIDARWPALPLALARAAIAPLAIERAPAGRVNAVVVFATADPASVDAAIAYLETAGSTTGQTLNIS